MCIAICKPQNIIIPDVYLEESFDYNPDGAGFMYAEGGQLHIEKGFMSFQEFMNAWEPHKEKTAALHFRIKTHGKIDEENTHPFQVGKNLGFIHNGIISNVETKEDPTKSDTYHFNQQFLTHLYKRDSRFIFKPHYSDLIKGYIGASKLVFLNNKGHFKIVNEQMGLWDEGVWYSNRSYKPVKYTPPSKTIQPALPSPPPFNRDSFSIGDKVRVKYADNENRVGYITHFGTGLSVGVREETTGTTSLVYLGNCERIYEEPFPTFAAGDWVVRNDEAYGDTDQIGEVQSLVGQAVVVKFLNDDGIPTGPDYFISARKLDFWSSTPNLCYPI